MLKHILSLPASWAVIGTIVGTLISAGTNVAIHWWGGRKQRRIATMRVAIELRQWLVQLEESWCDTQNWISSDGHGGTQHISIPRFESNDVLQQISSLKPKAAMRVFNLLHEIDIANAAIRAIAEHENDDDAMVEFIASAAERWLATVNVYRELSTSVGWIDDGPDSDSTSATRMRTEAERVRAQQKKRAEEAHKFMFGGG